MNPTIKTIAYIVSAFVAVILVIEGLNIKYSNGQRKGIVYKISKKGIIWKTWEGEMSLQLTTQGEDGRLVNQIFAFSVERDDVAELLQSKLALGQGVVVNYTQFLLRGIRHANTEYNVTGIREQ